MFATFLDRTRSERMRMSWILTMQLLAAQALCEMRWIEGA